MNVISIRNIDTQGGCQHVQFELHISNSSNPLPTSSPTPTPIQFYIAETDVSEYEQTIKIRMEIPKKGGPIQGKISGACNGSLQSNYPSRGYGGSQTQIKGTAEAVCLVFFKGEATFGGWVSEEEKMVGIGADIKWGDNKIHKTIQLPIINL